MYVYISTLCSIPSRYLSKIHIVKFMKSGPRVALINKMKWIINYSTMCLSLSKKIQPTLPLEGGWWAKHTSQEKVGIKPFNSLVIHSRTLHIRRTRFLTTVKLLATWKSVWEKRRQCCVYDGNEPDRYSEGTLRKNQNS